LHGHPEYFESPFDIGEGAVGLPVFRTQTEMAL
jgi:hypothetical protein